MNARHAFDDYKYGHATGSQNPLITFEVRYGPELRIINNFVREKFIKLLARSALAKLADFT